MWGALRWKVVGYEMDEAESSLATIALPIQSLKNTLKGSLFMGFFFSPGRLDTCLNGQWMWIMSDVSYKLSLKYESVGENTK